MVSSLPHAVRAGGEEEGDALHWITIAPVTVAWELKVPGAPTLKATTMSSLVPLAAGMGTGWIVVAGNAVPTVGPPA